MLVYRLRHIYGAHTVVELELRYLREPTQTLRVLRTLEISMTDGTSQRGQRLGNRLRET